VPREQNARGRELEIFNRSEASQQRSDERLSAGPAWTASEFMRLGTGHERGDRNVLSAPMNLWGSKSHGRPVSEKKKSLRTGAEPRKAEKEKKKKNTPIGNHEGS